jgi:hypothetical protein
MQKLLVGLGLMVTTLTACGLGQPVSTSIALPTPLGERVQCYYDGEVIFDQYFDRAETQVDGTVRVWIGVEYVDMDGDCRVATPTP